MKETLEEFSAFLKKQNYTMLVGKKNTKLNAFKVKFFTSYEFCAIKSLIFYRT